MAACRCQRDDFRRASCSRASGSSSAPAPAASGRRPPRRPSGWAWPSAACASRWSRSTRRGGSRPRSGSRSSATSRALVDPERFAAPRRRGRGRAVGDDARRQADLRLADRAPRARREHPRRGVRQPDLPAALERGRGLAGVHGDREALRARPGGRLRPAGARHAAVAQRARLPRRAAAAEGVLRRPRDPHVPAPGGAQRQGARAAAPAWCSRCSSASRASTCCRTCRCSSARSAG